MLNFNSRFKNHLTISALLISVSIFTSCGPDSNKANLMDPQVKYRSDTMYSHHRMSIVNEMDSLCILREDELISQSIDSIIQRRKKQIDAILNRRSN
ncbi:MAG: hypothetical protein ACI9FN_001268 [Saprospiraceae bacterium]|jgi:hypothetical protein